MLHNLSNPNSLKRLVFIVLWRYFNVKELDHNQNGSALRDRGGIYKNNAVVCVSKLLWLYSHTHTYVKSTHCTDTNAHNARTRA